MSKIKSIKDTVHGYIELEEDFWKIVDTPEFQRLRWIEQISYRTLYPSARHDRFIHSLGVFHLGKVAYDSFIKNGLTVIKKRFSSIKTDEIDVKILIWRESFLCACLLHDIGHAPFSHTFEAFFNYGESCKEKDSTLNLRLVRAIKNSCIEDEQKEKFISDYKYILNNWHKEEKDVNLPKEHEIVSAILILERYTELSLNKNMQENLDLIIRSILGCTYQFNHTASEDRILEYGIKNSIMRLLNSSSVDVDKLDYITRDSYMSGYENVKIDNSRLLTSLTVIIDKYGNIMLAFRKSALSVIANVITAKNLQSKWILAHPAVIYEDYLMKKSFGETVEAFIKKYCNGNEDKETCISKVCNIEDCQKFKCAINSTGEFVKRFFSLEAISLEGVTIQGRTFKLLSDADIISLMKEFLTKDSITNEFFSRNKRYKPVWKSVEEYIHIFKKEYNIEADILKKVYELFKPIIITNNLTKDIRINNSYGEQISSDNPELKKVFEFLRNFSLKKKDTEFSFVVLPINYNFSTQIIADKTYFLFDEERSSYSKYSDLMYENLIKAKSENQQKNEKSMVSNQDSKKSIEAFYIYSKSNIDRLSFIAALFDHFDVTY